MTMAAAIESRTAEAPARSKPSRIAGVDISTISARPRRSGAASKVQRHLSTPYQRFDFLSRLATAGRRTRNLSPFIVVAHDTERRPLLLLPLALRHEHGVRIASFMGGKHATFNMALWDRDFAASATAADLDALMSAIRARSRGRRSGAEPAAAALARPAEPDGDAAASGLGQ